MSAHLLYFCDSVTIKLLMEWRSLHDLSYRMLAPLQFIVCLHRTISGKLYIIGTRIVYPSYMPFTYRRKEDWT